MAISTAEEFNISAATSAEWGEDYELLFTISQSHYDAIKDDPDLTIIGHITDKSHGSVLVTKDENHQFLLLKAGMLYLSLFFIHLFNLIYLSTCNTVTFDKNGVIFLS